MDALGVSDTDLANRLDTTRTTVWRWRMEQWRLRPGKVKAIADALGIDERQLYELPRKETRPSLDDEARELPDPLYAVALQTIRALKGR